MKNAAKKDFKVLHLVRSLGIGGMEKVLIDLTNGLDKQGVVSHLGCLINTGVWAGKSKVEGVWTGNLGERRNIAVLFDLCRYLKREKISLIHSHNSHPHMYGVAASLLTGLPLVHTKHGRNWPDNPRWVLFSRCLSFFTGKIAAVSGDIARIVTDIEKVPARKVEIVLNGVDVSRFSSEAGPASSGSRGFTVGSIGRFSPEKNYELLVRAFSGFRKKRQDAVLVLVGDGPCGEQIKSAIKEHGLQSACVLPGEQDDIRSWLQMMDVFCLSSDQEGTSITLLEAGAAGLASVVTAVGGNGEVVVNGETGIVVPAGDCVALTGAFERLAGDENLRKKMGACARKRIQERYSMDRMVEHYIRIYEEAAGVSLK